MFLRNLFRLNNSRQLLLGMCTILGISLPISATSAQISFDDLPLGNESYFNGPTANATTVSGPYGPEEEGTFSSGGASFINRYDTTYDSWHGFAYSNVTNNADGGYENQYSAFPGGGHGTGNDNYAVGYIANSLIDPNDVGDLFSLPYLTLAAGQTIQGAYFGNSTYAALIMRDGDPLGYSKKFGGDSGNDPDWFKLTVYGVDALGNPLSSFAELYLADYRFNDNSLDYVLSNWTYLDLTELAGASTLHFNVTSSDAGSFGNNTPSYFAMDDIQVAAVPEPSSLALLGISMLGAGYWGRFRRRDLAK